jgi:isoleucyl-tRNA synthetase
MIYKGHRIVPYCPRCGTALSDHELAQGYADVDDPSVYVRFRLKDMENTSFLVWTTTPWTLLSNVAVAVHPEEEYVKIEHEGQYFILVKPRAFALFGEDAVIIGSFKGNELAGMDYEPLYTFTKLDKKAHYVITATYVTTTDGTGIVHIAPAFGQDDYEQGKKYDLPFVQLVKEDGTLPEEAEPFAGLFIKKADPLIMDDLYKRGLLFKRGKITHNYPFCWRCNSPIIYFARESWYIRTTAFKDKMLENNSLINWYPKTIGEGRFGDWLRNNIDWALSRERYWGTPLPIWVCQKCGKMHATGSIEDLRNRSLTPLAEPLDLHRPDIDNIYFTCDAEGCDGIMKRTPEVIDCWFDSGAMPFAQHHFPFEHCDDFEKKYFPADFISEGVDQTRGWFYTLLAISTFIKGVSPYKDCVVIGLVLDAEGRKMSKSLGNAIAPSVFWEKWGADPLRWFLISNSQPWLPTRMDTDSVSEITSKVFDTFKNCYKFFVTYSNIDDFDPDSHFPSPNELSLIDRWILSRSETLSARVFASMDEYDMTRASRDIAGFILDDLSNWFVRRSRKRFWGGGLTADKRAAYHTLYRVLMTTIKLMAPLAPMTAEAYYRWLGGKLESVHLESFPRGNEADIDERLESMMKSVKDIASLGLSLRNKAKIRVRQPLRTLWVSGMNIDFLKDEPELLSLLLDELNVKELLDGTGMTFSRLFAKANFRTLGKKLGKDVNEGAELITKLDRIFLKKQNKAEQSI